MHTCFYKDILSQFNWLLYNCKSIFKTFYTSGWVVNAFNLS